MALMTGPATCLVCQRDERAGPWADLNCPESTLRGCQPVTGLNASCPLFRLGHSAMSAQCPDAPESGRRVYFGGCLKSANRRHLTLGFETKETAN
jgi:hypothetical protein